MNRWEAARDPNVARMRAQARAARPRVERSKPNRWAITFTPAQAMKWVVVGIVVLAAIDWLGWA